MNNDTKKLIGWRIPRGKKQLIGELRIEILLEEVVKKRASDLIFVGLPPRYELTAH